MLNLFVTMNSKIAKFVFQMILLISAWNAVLPVNRPMIDSPRAGDVLQGVVSITGSTNVVDFQAAELSFSYADQESDAWFLISRSEQPLEKSLLAEWDTTLIADGTYQLRLRLILTDGNYLEVVVPDLRVRNYSAVETSTPQPAVGSLTATPLPPAVDFSAGQSPTDLPHNPAAVTQQGLEISLRQGAIFAVVLFVALSLYLGLRSLSR